MFTDSDVLRADGFALAAFYALVGAFASVAAYQPVLLLQGACLVTVEG